MTDLSKELEQRSQAVRQVGRPRSTEADAAIVAATLDLFAELGFDGMSIEAVAARAGVGKTTIYRRWPSKQDLVVDAMDSLAAEVADPDTGTTRTDLIALLGHALRLITSTKAGDALPRMAAEIATSSPLGRRYVETVLNPRRALVATIIERGIRRGELRADLDARLAVDSVMGPVILRKLMGELQVPPEDFPERLVDSVLQGMLPR